MRPALLFPLASFLGAFQLFLIQPLMARQLLPWFGGGASVWSTCLVFFQVALVGGYAYAHLTRRLGLRRQMQVHVLLLVLAAAMLPITVPGEWQPENASAPIAKLLLILLGTVGPPYVLLAANAPLLQDWYAISRGAGGLAYRLYVQSNAGSLGALLLYPVAVEPFLSSSSQALVWSAGYVVFAAICAACGWQAVKTGASAPPLAGAPRAGLARLDAWLWFGLSACGSALLLAVTNRMTQDVASVPLLWVVPLSLYLTTFIVCFAGAYRRASWIATFIAGMVAASAIQLAGPGVHVGWQTAALALLLVAACMLCHGELVQLKPPPDRLTTFYLVLAIGGAAGGLFVALAAPLLFTGYAELPLFTLLTPALVMIAVAQERAGRTNAPLPAPLVVAPIALMALAVTSAISFARPPAGAIFASRSFYGVLSVTDDPLGKTARLRRLYHGRILHGSQFLDPSEKGRATAYYAEGSGVHVAIAQHPRRLAEGPLEIGVIGLGVGASAAWAQAGDRLTFYELNPEVLDVATRYFSFLGESSAATTVELGDGRLTLERHLRQGLARGRFHVLAVDAFSGDSVPVHLLTREAFEVYFRALALDGVLALHISNHHLNLEPVVRGLAGEIEKETLRIHTTGDDPGSGVSHWMLVSSNAAFLQNAVKFAAPSNTARQVVWTDDFSSLVHVLRW